MSTSVNNSHRDNTQEETNKNASILQNKLLSKLQSQALKQNASKAIVSIANEEIDHSDTEDEM